MLVTEPGRETEDREVHPENAQSPMDITEEGSVNSLLPAGKQRSTLPSLLRRIPSTEEYKVLSGSTSIDIREVHPRNAPSPMKTTVDGTDWEDREMHPLNASSPMLVTEPGMETEDREEHIANVLFSMDVTESGMETEDRERHLWNA